MMHVSPRRNRKLTRSNAVVDSKRRVTLSSRRTSGAWPPPFDCVSIVAIRYFKLMKNCPMKRLMTNTHTIEVTTAAVVDRPTPCAPPLVNIP